jgi:hypothetical protein
MEASRSPLRKGGFVYPHPHQLPYQPIRRAPPDPDVPFVNADEVMKGAQRDQVLRLVGAALGPRNDVVDVHRPPAAPGHLAPAAVALADLL